MCQRNEILVFNHYTAYKSRNGVNLSAIFYRQNPSELVHPTQFNE